MGGVIEGIDARVPAWSADAGAAQAVAADQQGHAQAGLGQAQRSGLGNRAIANYANITFDHAQRRERWAYSSSHYSVCGNRNWPLRFAGHML
jgi:hypothetical protein